MVYTKRKTCRICGGDRLRLFLELGPQPPANSYPQTTDDFADEATFPLDVCFCEDCTLVQTPDVIDAEVLFRHYVYVTGTSDTMAEHNRGYAQTVTDLLKLSSDDLVVEIASNDGSLLRCFQKHGVKVLGIEPALNIAELARVAGVETVTEFFNHAAAGPIREQYGPARAVIGNNVLAHVDDTVDFLRGCGALLADDGLVVIEVPYLGELLERFEYDTIYHEHLCYFSVMALVAVCDAVGLSIVRMDDFPVHGGSVRMYAGRPEHYGGHNQGVLDRVTRERELGLDKFARYERFAEDVVAHRSALVALLTSLRKEGKSLAAYGAPAKGNTLLNYCGIDTSVIEFTVDKNPLKVGSFTPGMHLPVLETGELLARQPDYVVILAWNFAEEIMRQQSEYQSRGGRFIIPIPKPSVV